MAFTSLPTDCDASSQSGDRLGVCVLSWNSGEAVSRCLDSIQHATTERQATVVVVDNHSADDSAERARRHALAPHVIVTEANLGYARGNNLGVAALLTSGCTHSLVINPDVNITRETLTELRQALDTNSRAGCAGGRADSSSLAFRNRPTVLQKLLFYGQLRDLPVVGHVLRPILRRSREEHYISSDCLPSGAEVHAVSGACLLFRSEAFAEVDGFDPRTFLYEEEFIMGERLRAFGWTVVAAPNAIYHHSHGHSTKQIRVKAYWHFIHSEQLLIRAYYHWGVLASCSVLAVRLAEFGCWVVWSGMSLLVRGLVGRIAGRSAAGVIMSDTGREH